MNKTIVVFEGEQNAFTRLTEFKMNDKALNSPLLILIRRFFRRKDVDEVAIRLNDGTYIVAKHEGEHGVSGDVSHNDPSRSA